MKKSVAILLCTYNGERFIEEQIRSIFEQSFTDWELYISDDGSTDNTLGIIESLMKEYHKENVFFLNGPRQGFAKNFISLLSIGRSYDYYAFSDQDDIWDREKLEVGVKTIAEVEKNKNDFQKPILYCGRTRLINAEGKVIGYSPLFKKKTSFVNSLVQSIAGGNTMIFNTPLFNVLKKMNAELKYVSHDWSIYQIATAIGAEVIYDKKPYVSYRQHGNNLIGSNNSVSAKAYRIKMLMRNEFKSYNDLNEKILLDFYSRATEDNKKILSHFVLMRRSKLLKRFCLYFKIKIYRQTFSGNLGLILAIFFNKI